VVRIDLTQTTLREANARLQGVAREANDKAFTVANPNGAHAVAAGLTEALHVAVEGHVGYYCAGMNQEAVVEIHGNAGTGVAENIVSGEVRVHGNASQSAGASGHGGLVVIDGDASSRCGISMKGVDIVVGGSVGHMSAFMAQAGHLVVCGDAGRDLGDSIYEAVLYVAGSVDSLGSDCIEKDMTEDHRAALAALLARAGMDADVRGFRRYGSARKLYNFEIDNAGRY
jgi:glutamate synthase domain-containing protein 3